MLTHTAHAVVLSWLLDAVHAAAEAGSGVSMTVQPGSVRGIINGTSPGSAGNRYGYEDGSVRKIGDTFHMFVSEEISAPQWDGMRLGHWASTAPAGDADWTRLGTLELDGKPMLSSKNCSDRAAHTGALWSPISFFEANTWYLNYVGYDCPGNVDGVIKLAKSTVPGPDGIGGPYASVDMLMARNHSVPWEGNQGDDSFFAFHQPASAGGALLALYGSSDGASYWDVGLARSASGTIRGPWVRPPENELQIQGGIENPIVLEVKPQRSGGEPLLVAVFDNIHSESTGFGLT